MQSTSSPVPKYRVAVILSSATSLRRGRNCSVCSGYMHRVCEEGQQTLKGKISQWSASPSFSGAAVYLAGSKERRRFRASK